MVVRACTRGISCVYARDTSTCDEVWECVEMAHRVMASDTGWLVAGVLGLTARAYRGGGGASQRAGDAVRSIQWGLILFIFAWQVEMKEVMMEEKECNDRLKTCLDEFQMLLISANSNASG